jgi:hypothetical protein
MRHLVSLLFGIVLAPVIWFLAALGQFRLLQALPRDGVDRGSLTALGLGALLIVAAGIWLGILLGTRLSPVGPGIAGVAWLVLGGAFIVNTGKVTSLLPDGPSGQNELYTLPLRHGYAFLIGTALLVPLFSPARWRAREQVVDEVEIEPYGTVEQPPYTTAEGRYPATEAARYPTADEPRTGRHDAANVRRRDGENVQQPPANPYRRERGYGRERGWSGATDEEARRADPGAPQPRRRWGESAGRNQWGER